MSTTKDEYIQIRISKADKEILKKQAKAQGLDLSSYLLSNSLSKDNLHLQQLLDSLPGSQNYKLILADINDFLSSLVSSRLKSAVSVLDIEGLDEFYSNYICAMIELACIKKNIAPPGWRKKVKPLDSPHFASKLKSLRLHLMANSPAPFKARNIFIDSSLGDRV